MAGVGVENVFDRPGQGPVNVPLLVFLCLDPPPFFEVLDEGALVKVGLVPEFLALVLGLHSKYEDY